jgi:hypothetical protein
VAVAHFPKELPIPPRSCVAREYNVTRWTELAARPVSKHIAVFMPESPQTMPPAMLEEANRLKLVI